MTRFVIVGGGPSGLAAAFEATRHGAAAVVIEKLDRVGGLARTLDRDGNRYDIGPHRFFTMNVEVRELFFATPARLKFLKEPRTESGHVADALRRLAMAHPAIAFRLESEERTLVDLPAANPSLLDKPDAARLERLAAIMGREFADNALAIDANREGFRLTGFAGLPTLNRPTSQHQYLFVNGRPVRDKLLAGAVRNAPTIRPRTMPASRKRTSVLAGCTLTSTSPVGASRNSATIGLRSRARKSW